jgi:molybdopterin synthase catalytic subunit
MNRDLLQVTEEPIIQEEFLTGLRWDECGALVTFTGRVRGYSDDKRVISLEHCVPAETADRLLKEIATEMRRRWQLGEIAICYRSGPVEAGGITIVIAVAAPHRPEAFAACEYAIDRFKESVSATEIREDGEFRIGGKS